MSNVDKTAKAPTVSVNGGARLYQIAIAALVGMVVTGAGAYLTEGRGHLNRLEVRDMLNTEAPFIRVEGEFRQLVVDVREMRRQLGEQTAEIAALRQAVTSNTELLRRQ